MFNQRNLSLGRGDDGTVLCVLHLWIQSIMDRNYLEENNPETGEVSQQVEVLGACHGA